VVTLQTDTPLSRCERCQIPAGLLLLDDYFPISSDYLQYLSTEERLRVTHVSLSDNICQACRAYQQYFDPEMLLAERNLLFK